MADSTLYSHEDSCPSYITCDMCIDMSRYKQCDTYRSLSSCDVHLTKSADMSSSSSCAIFSDRTSKVSFKSLAGKIIGIEGTVGVGKSTLGRSLELFLQKQGLNAKYYPEYKFEEFLEQYISNQTRYAYAFQLVMLSKRIQTYRDAVRFTRSLDIQAVESLFTDVPSREGIRLDITDNSLYTDMPSVKGTQLDITGDSRYTEGIHQAKGIQLDVTDKSLHTGVPSVKGIQLDVTDKSLYTEDIPLTEGILQVKEITSRCLPSSYEDARGVAILDRSLLGDYTFALMQKDRGNFTSEEWEIYNKMVDREITTEPDVILYLDCTPDVAMKRIRRRGLDAEIKGYSIEYLTDLHNAYSRAIKRSSKTLNVNWNRDDTVSNGFVSETLVTHIAEKIVRYIE